MNTVNILYPVFFMVLLTVLVSLKLMYVNIKTAKNKQVHFKFFALYQGPAPDAMLQARDHYKNLFELPILFYLLCLMLYSGEGLHWLDLVLAWAFVIFRYIHSFIRATSNFVPRRFKVFSMGAAALLVHWCFFAYRISF